MSSESEQMLEDKLIEQLVEMGYQKVSVRTEDQLIVNLKTQLEVLNKTSLTDGEFQQILTYITKSPSIFKHAEVLREHIPYVKEDGEHAHLILLNQKYWCQNEFQVTHQFNMEGTYKNRYDVTILINGLPLVQIELKRRGLELKEAFNQVNRYQRTSYTSGYGLFQFIQLFVFSNGTNTKYFANDNVGDRDFKQTFFWTDDKNKRYSQLQDFAQHFLEPCHISKMITHYMVLSTSNKLMVLRPYQFYAVEALVERVKKSKENGYIWHTTGAGKTLTSFKAAQIISKIKTVHKVLFVVDRKDLDYQTTKEFNRFRKGSVDATKNTKSLVNQILGSEQLIVTTIQKLNNAIINRRFKEQIEGLSNERIIFIFDECHRSQFGDTHLNIRNFFPNAQLFGFTGTPIFAENAQRNDKGKRTTKHLFDKCLHKYLITDAINDGNVLKFAVEYIRTFKAKDHIDDIEIEAINEPEVMDAPVRRDIIVNHIIQKHEVRTKNGRFNAIFCVSSVPNAIAYYNLFKEKREQGLHNLKVATIFSYEANPEDGEFDALNDSGLNDEQRSLMMAADGKVMYLTKSPREQLDDFIADYNKMFATNFSTRDGEFYNYYNNLSGRVKDNNLDILIVVDMFLTGFDSKMLNTLYVDKNLRYHGLIQAYSRTNRICGQHKTHGNIVVYRNLKAATDEAIKMFADDEPTEDIIEPAYEDLLEKFEEAYDVLTLQVPTPDSVDELYGEENKAEFVKNFRRIIRLINRMKQYEDFDFSNLALSELMFNDFRSKYLDLYEEVSSGKEQEKVSIINDLDFEVELLQRDEINVDYIIQLLVKLKGAELSEREKQIEQINKLLSSEEKLRSKRELIEEFMEKQLPLISDSDEVLDRFADFILAKRKAAMKRLTDEENLDTKKFDHLLSEYLYTQKLPIKEEVLGALNVRPKLLQQPIKAEEITNKLKEYVNVYIDGFSMV